MTTVNAVAAGHGGRRAWLAVVAAVLSAALAGCETTGGLFGQSGEGTAPTATAAPATPAASQAPRARVALAPVIGAPEAVSRQIASQLTEALARQNLTVAKGPTEPVDYTLRGYIVAAKEKTGTKVSYIWDVTDTAGKRVNRITGEELLAAAAADPWTAVTPPVVQTIADRTASSLVAALPAAPSGASTGALTQTSQGSAPRSPPSASGGPAAPGATTTGSLSQGGLPTLVPNVTGAPGDGGQSLAGALQRELSRSGLSLVQTAGPDSYRVEGKVTVGKASNGKQPIQIDWLVKDPKGNKLGTVSQKNEIPPGSLDGAWGKTADLAAAAAAQGILKLLPQTSTN